MMRQEQAPEELQQLEARVDVENLKTDRWILFIIVSTMSLT